MNDTIQNQLSLMNQQVKELASVYHNIASRAGISDNEFWVWYSLLSSDTECAQQDICDRWSLPKQTVNSVVSNLQKKGYVILEAAPGMKNRKIIRLSDEGRQFGNHIIMRIHQAENIAFAKLTEQERQNGIDLLRKYITLLKGEVYEN